MPINVNYSPDLAVMANFAQRAGYGDYAMRQQQMAMQQQQQAVENSLRERQFQDNVARNQSQAWTGWIGQQDAMARARSQAWMQDAQLRDQSALNWAKFGESSQAQRFNDQMRQAQGYMQYEKAYGDYTNDAGRVANQQQQIADQRDYRNQVLQREQAESIQRYGQPSSGDDLYDYANSLGQYSNSLAQQQMQAQSANNQARIQGQEDLQKLKWSREDEQGLKQIEGQIAAVRAAIGKTIGEDQGMKKIEELESQKETHIQQSMMNSRIRRKYGIGQDEPVDAVQHRQKTTSVDENGNTWAVSANGDPKLVINKVAEDAKREAELTKSVMDSYNADLKEWQKNKAANPDFAGEKPDMKQTYEQIKAIRALVSEDLRGSDRQAAAEQKAMTEPIVQELQSIADVGSGYPQGAQLAAKEIASAFSKYPTIDDMPGFMRKQVISNVNGLKEMDALTPAQEKELTEMVTPGEQLTEPRKLTRKQEYEAGIKQQYEAATRGILGQGQGGPQGQPGQAQPMPPLPEMLPPNTPDFIKSKAIGLQRFMDKDWTQLPPGELDNLHKEMTEDVLVALPPQAREELRRRALEAARAKPLKKLSWREAAGVKAGERISGGF